MGEAFDKVAKMLSLPYPGGPQVELAAAGGDAKRFALPRPMLGRADANFSLSGLKTAVRQVAERHTPLTGDVVNDLCAGFQTAVVAAGGVAANAAIRAALDGVAADAGLPLLLPPAALCTDNGAMIAWAGA